jgi:hypothetical protein
MKRFIITLFISLISLVGFSQISYPTTYNFTGLGGWSVTNGAGIQVYGGSSWLTTNIGTTPYPNSATVTMVSPVLNMTNCISGLSVTFLHNGIIQNGFDFLYFQYTTNGSTWTTLDTYTGLYNSVTHTYSGLPNNIIQFRFCLITNATINSYVTGPPGPPGTAVYFYDFDNFVINCSNPLPIELLSFDGFNYNSHNLLSWKTATEMNNDFYTIERSSDGINWEKVANIDGAGTSTTLLSYTFKDYMFIKDAINYYRLKQTDFNGQYEYSGIISIDNQSQKVVKLITTYDLTGVETTDTKPGMYIQHIEYTDRTIEVKKIIIQ